MHRSGSNGSLIVVIVSNAKSFRDSEVTELIILRVYDAIRRNRSNKMFATRRLFK